jgi:hypothetical protein
MAFPNESIQLGVAFKNLNIFATFWQPVNPLLTWNGSAWVTDTLANSILGAVYEVGSVQITTDASGNASILIPAGISVQFMYAIWPQAGATPAQADMTTPPTGVNIPLWVGTNGDEVVTLTAAAIATVATAVWATGLPGSFTLGQAGYILGNISGGFYTPAQIAAAVWQDVTAGDFTVPNSAGKILVTQLGGTLAGGTSIFTAAALQNTLLPPVLPVTAITTPVTQSVTQS